MGGVYLRQTGNVSAGGIVGQNDGTENTYSNNYHRSNIGGIGWSDVPGQAMFGYTITAESPIEVSLPEGATIGLEYEGLVYAGEGQSVVVNISALGYIPSDGYTVSAGTLTQNGSAFTLVMPQEDVAITGNMVAVKSFVTEGDWCETDNWMPAGLPTLADDIYLFANATVPSGCVAEANSININGNSLTIEDGGQLKSNSNVSATIKKHITGYGESTNGGWYLVGFPTSVFPGPVPSDLGLITTESDYDFYYFAHNVPDGLEWRNYKAGSINRIQALLRYGYLYANAADMDIVLSNSLNGSANDDIIGLFYTGNYSFKGWALHGNPFPCNAYVFDDATGEYRSFYRMNAAGDGLIPATGVIYPMEGFFAQATATGQQLRISRNAAPAQANIVSIDLVEGNAVAERGGASTGSTTAPTDRAILRFGDGNTLEKFSLSESTSKIYIPQGGKDYAVAAVGGVSK